MTFNSKVEQAKALAREYLEKYPGKCVVTNSFGKDSMVLFHIVNSVKLDVPVVSIMTPFKFPATYKYKEKMTKKYKMNIATGTRSERTDKPRWWEKDPNACCNYYKVEPMEEGLAKYDVWFAGLRRDEGATRAVMEFVVSPDRYGKIKVNPILFFTEKDIWRYLALYEIPANPMYKQGYRSLGCMYCSHKEKDEGEGERDGRWKGTKKCGGECGIHSFPKK